MESKKDGIILGYNESKKKRTEIGNFRTFEYYLPFNYDNINVVRVYCCGETHGMESNPINSYWPDTNHRPSDYIEIEEEQGIVFVDVIGSACTPPGYVMLEADVMDGFRRIDEINDIMPVRFRVNNLWGMHLRADQWLVKDTDVPRFEGKCSDRYQSIPEEFIKNNPGLKGYKMKMDYRELPLTGMSSAQFSIPRSNKIRIMAGSEILGWTGDSYPDDAHYSIRMIRVTVCDVLGK
jgi:hypothetical protein